MKSVEGKKKNKKRERRKSHGWLHSTDSSSNMPELFISSSAPPHTTHTTSQNTSHFLQALTPHLHEGRAPVGGKPSTRLNHHAGSHDPRVCWPVSLDEVRSARKGPYLKPGVTGVREVAGGSSEYQRRLRRRAAGGRGSRVEGRRSRLTW